MKHYRIGLKIDTIIKWFVINRTQYPPDEWNQFAITINLNGNRIPCLYINGKLIAHSDSFGLDDFYLDPNGNQIGTIDQYEFNDAVLPYSGHPLFIGGANIIKQNSFQGYIQKITLLDKALNTSQIQSIQ